MGVLSSENGPCSMESDVIESKCAESNVHAGFKSGCRSFGNPAIGPQQYKRYNEPVNEINDLDPSHSLEYKNILLRPTIQFMDYRRLRRRFNGIRKPISSRKAIAIAVFSIFLASLPFIQVDVTQERFLLGIAIQRSLEYYATALGFVIGIYFLFRWQLVMPLKLPVAISYVFMISTITALFVVREALKLSDFIWITFAVYTGLQLLVLLFSQALIYYGPLLALNGMYFPCSEHFNLLLRQQQGSRLNINISRYNDYSVMCGVNACGICTCIYRSSYRWLRWCYRKYNARFLGNYFKKVEAPFSHQMRYKGEVDRDSLPHGYGEWLEDDSYGERLKGYWWHGYPIGPFSSQEIGSGSIFTNTRVAFVTDTRKSPDDIRFGVACTECSMSGHFFREFPLTYFFDPSYNSTNEDKAANLHKKPKHATSCLFFKVLNSKYDYLQGASMDWCVQMLKLQFYLNMPSSNGTVAIYLDKITRTLRVEGYRRVQGSEHPEGFQSAGDDTTVVVGVSSVVSTPSPKSTSSVTQPREEVNGVVSFLNAQLYADVFPSDRSGHNQDTDGNPNQDDNNSDDGIKKYFACPSHSRVEGSSSALAEDSARGRVSFSHQHQERVADLFHDEDDWKTKRAQEGQELSVRGWAPINSIGYSVHEAVIYIHGYYVSLAEGCSQMAHIVSFSKLPPYILPFVFNWDGKHWGSLGAFAYPKAKSITQDPKLQTSFEKLLNELQKINIRHVHFIVRSCGARIFFNVFEHCVNKCLFVRAVENDKGLNRSPSLNTNSKPTLQIDSCILLNPDYPLETFKQHDYFLLRSYCNNIVMYADTRDQCLQLADLYNREHSLGRAIFGLRITTRTFASLGGYADKQSKAADPITVNDSHVIQMDQESRPVPSQYTMYKDPLTSCSYSRNNSIAQIPHLGVGGKGLTLDYLDYAKTEQRWLWLDMDVIDTSMIDTNVDFLKHSLYEMKREIMDDLREVIMLRTRAEQRQSRLDRRRGNVFVFRVAPAGVANLFAA